MTAASVCPRLYRAAPPRMVDRAQDRPGRDVAGLRRLDPWPPVPRDHRLDQRGSHHVEVDRMTTKPPNFGDAPWPERDPEVPYDHERAAKEFLDAADRICSQAKVGAIPFDINLITAAQVNATIGVGEALLAILQELRSRSKAGSDRSVARRRCGCSRKVLGRRVGSQPSWT
jgi:hypothetical protein